MSLVIDWETNKTCGRCGVVIREGDPKHTVAESPTEHVLVCGACAEAYDREERVNHG